MGVLKLSIEFDKHAKSYFAGETLTGNVIINISVEKSFKELVITYFGKVRVAWNRNGKNKTQDKTVRRPDVNDEEIFFNHTVSLFDAPGETNVITLPPGEHRYPFSYQIPSGIPSSFYGTYGYVRYHVGVRLRKAKPYNRDREIKVPFTVNGILDLNNETSASASGEIRKETVAGSCCFCFRRGTVKFTMKMFRNGVVPGEYLPIVMELSNLSQKEVSIIHLSLFQENSYYAPNVVKKMEQCSVVKVKREGLGPGELATWAGDILKVPSVPPTKLGKCSLICVNYFLRLEMEIYGEKNLVGTIPIVVGTIPLRNNFLDLVPPEGFDPDAEFYTPVNLLGYPDLPPPSYLEAIQMPPFSSDPYANCPLYKDISFSDQPDGPTVIKKRETLALDVIDSSQGKNKTGESDSDEEYDNGETTLVSPFDGFIPKYVNYYDGKPIQQNEQKLKVKIDDRITVKESQEIRESTIM